MGLRVVFCTTCKNRTQHLEQTLPLNILHNPQAKFVVLDYNCSDHFHKYISENYEHLLKDGMLSVYSFRTPESFRMAHAKNMAHRLGILEGADVLINLDADNIAGVGFADYVSASLSKNPKSFLWANMVKGEMPRGISGRIAVTKEAFLLSGGYDEKYETWGPDDKQFNKRLRMMGYAGYEIPARYLRGVKHTDKLRFREYRHAETQMVEEDFDLDDCGETIVNFGRIGCGVVYKNFDFSNAISLDPVPTRIFGLGLHKTATTSLHHALSMLGFSSAHWPSAHWAKNIWNEMHQLGRSPTVESTHCSVDLPIPLLYKSLDVAYPSSKFILTIRNEHDWITSVRNHWSDRNQFKGQWDSDPFTHKIHRELYGRTQFDADVFLARYRQHNQEVIEHFKNRPHDLYVMNMDEGGDWFGLCRFLNCRIPSTSYPKKYITA